MKMNKHLSKSALRVNEMLIEKGLSCEVIELSASTRTANEAALALGCEVAQIVKSILFCSQSSQSVLILASGSNRVNEKTIAKYLGEGIEKADADFTRKVTGFAIGGVAPIGHLLKINHILIDEDLLKHETLWAAAGTPHAVFSLPSTELQKLTNGKVLCIK